MSIDAWTKFYYAHPEPERLVAEVRALAALPQLADPGKQIAIATFLGRVMAAHPDRIEDWTDELEDLAGPARRVLEIAARLSDTREGIAWLESVGSPLARSQPPDLFAAALEDGSVLDALWSHYFATGEARAVRRIVAAFENLGVTGAAKAYATSAKTELDRKRAILDSVYQAAAWSVSSLCAEHAPLLALAEELVAAPDLSPNERIGLALCLERAAPQRWRVAVDPATKTATIQRLQA